MNFDIERRFRFLSRLSNIHIIEMTKEITVARMQNTTTPPTADGGKNVADFMQAIYDKLIELNQKAN